MAETEVAVTFDDMTVLSEGDVDVFVLNWNDTDEPPPYWVDVAGRRFGFTSTTFLVVGHRALLSDYVREQEAAGRLVLLVERFNRFLAYVHDPAAQAEEDAADVEAVGAGQG